MNHVTKWGTWSLTAEYNMTTVDNIELMSTNFSDNIDGLMQEKLLMHWSYVFLALTHRCVHLTYNFFSKDDNKFSDAYNFNSNGACQPVTIVGAPS